MITFKKIDDFLRSFLTMHRYPKRLKTPFSQFLYAVGFNLVMLGIFISPDFIDGQIKGISYIIALAFLLAIFYHWRLWKHQEKEGKHKVENS
jgi:hypothetical protein